jgi:glycosyltransferase involved in cell wall biosynthesis
MTTVDSGRRMLVIGPRVLTPDMDAGSSRMYRLLVLLRAQSSSATFLASFPDSWPPFSSRVQDDTSRLRQAGIEVPETSGLEPVEDHLRSRGREYTAVMLTGEYVAAKYMQSVRRHAPQALVVFDTGDLHYLRHYREAKITRNARALKRSLKSKRRELAAAREADYTLVVSQEEKSILEGDCPGARVYVLPSIHEVYGSARPFSQRKDLVFVGSFQHTPNLDAVKYLAEKIMPLVWDKSSSVKTYVIGSDPPDHLADLASEQMIFTGYVPDLAQYFDSCRISVAPLRFGAGVKGKVLTSLSYGVPVVASSIAAEGLFLTHGEDVLIADEARAFAEAVMSLYRDESLWNRLSRKGLDTVSRHFSPTAAKAALTELLAQMEKDYPRG